MTSTADIRAVLFLVAPEFESTDPVQIAKIDSLIDLLKPTISLKAFGETYALAVAYKTAHILSSTSGGGTTVQIAGSLIREKEGDLERQYSAPMSTESMEQTNYGKLYQDLAKSKVITVNIASGF